MTVNYVNLDSAIRSTKFSYSFVVGNDVFQRMRSIDKLVSYSESLGFSHLIHKITDQDPASMLKTVYSQDLFICKRLLQFNFCGKVTIEYQRILLDMMGNLNSNDCYLFVFEDMPYAQQKSKWFQECIKNSLCVRNYAVNINIAITIIKLEIKSLNNVSLSLEAIRFLAEKTEGNLLEAYQILLLISAQPKSHFAINDVNLLLFDFMIYDTFDLVDSILNQNKHRALKIVSQLLQNKVSPSAILWAIIRELRLLIELTIKKNDISYQGIISKSNPYTRNTSLYRNLTSKFTKKEYVSLILRCLDIDYIIKGVKVGHYKQKLINLVSYLIRV